MREIKFRAWDKNHKEMMTDLVMNFNGNLYCRDISKENTFYVRDVKHEVELMQFTGLKDKNGKEIYEGDILEIGGDKFKGDVIWNDKFAEWKINHYNHSLGLLLETMKYEDVEVIGNIYENKELLEEKNEN